MIEKTTIQETKEELQELKASFEEYLRITNAHKEEELKTMNRHIVYNGVTALFVAVLLILRILE